MDRDPVVVCTYGQPSEFVDGRLYTSTGVRMYGQPSIHIYIYIYV